MVSRELSAYVLRRTANSGAAQMQVKSPERTDKEKGEASLRFDKYRQPAQTYFGMVPPAVMNRFPRYWLAPQPLTTFCVLKTILGSFSPRHKVFEALGRWLHLYHNPAREKFS